MEIREPNFLRPVAPHRLKAYTVLLTVVGVVFVGTTIGLGTGLLSPSVTLDVTANLLFGLPVIVLPIVLFWKAPGAAIAASIGHRTHADLHSPDGGQSIGLRIAVFNRASVERVDSDL
jgi:hypothetical protein